MGKSVLITTEFKRIDKRRWPPYVRAFIESPDINSIRTWLGSKIAYHKFNTEAYPRLLFFEEKDSHGNIIYVIRKYFEDHRAYDVFKNLSEEQKCQKGKYSPSEQKELDAAFAQFVEETPKQPLPVSMRDFERSRDFSNTATTYVFEMEEWCKHIRNREFEDDRKAIFEVVQKIVIEKESPSVDLEGWHSISFAEKQNKQIVFRVHEYDSHVYYFLFEIGVGVDISALVNKYRDLSDTRLLKQARKGYPDWILYGEFEDWKKLENDDEANLALSDEEVEVLNKTPYPYFVNGLAGSGKSTILYYLFAHAYSYKEIKPLQLLFLSYSPGLVTKAKSVIKALLRTNPSYHGFELTETGEKDFEKCFWPFQKFLTHTFLDTNEEKSEFVSINHLSYEQFVKDYNLNCKLNEARSYKAAMVWSVIRSFIKGRDYKSIFTIENYNKLHKSDRTVDPVDYENIYRIWKNWYKPTYEGKRWDDLDLIRYILKKLDAGYEFSKYDIIYCDEAQDFTSIENILILRLSRYTDFDLKEYQEIPIAYAGDPNQTVNPTGFNWKRLKEIVDSTFSTLVGSHIKLCERTLNNNYRSKRTIVEFANSLQYIRRCFLSDDVLKPQEQWNPQANPLPGFFFLTRNDGNEDDTQTIKAGFAKTECIITGADGEYERKLDKDELTEESTVLEDELLATIDNKTKLYTAISSKGLEFKAVLLYRFADQLPKSFSKILAKEEILNESDRYDLSHFFTKLYIAVSRAKEVLYIADTQENYDCFWRYFIDNVFVSELMTDMADSASWFGKVGGIVLGDRAEYLSRMTENFNPLETATKIFEDAKLDENSKDMNRAVGYFEEAGDFTMADKCKAYVLLYEKEYLKAGQKFLTLGIKDLATKAFWQGCCWNELVQHSDRAVYRIAAQFMTSSLKLVDLIKKEELIDNMSSLDETWTQVVIKINNEAKKTDSDLIYATCTFLESLVNRGFSSLSPTIAELYFRNKQYSKAVQKWDELALTHPAKHYNEHKSYYAAKEELSPTTSDKLFWMHKGGKYDEILNNYSTPKDAEIFMLDERAKRIVFSLLAKQHTFAQALAYPLASSDKLNLLYKTDRIQFIEQYVLEDFDEEKFVNWIERPITDNDSDLFDIELPITLFKRIFSLPMMKDWVLFMKLRDNGGYRVMRNGVNANRIADAICEALQQKNYKSLASCFLDAVFNNPNYNSANANKHLDTLLKVFEQNDFSERDFILKSQRNPYFAACELEGHDLDTIKDRLRSFVETKLSSYKKKIKSSDFHMFKVLCRIYEKAAPQVQDDRLRYVYDYETVLTFYNSLKKSKLLPEELIKFVEIRKSIISSRYKSRQNMSTFAATLPTSVTEKEVMETFDKEDSVWFIGFAFGKSKVYLDAVTRYVPLVAKLVYQHDIQVKDFDRRETKANLRNNLIQLADDAIQSLLSKDKVDDYLLKLYSYIYEVFLEGDNDKAKKFDTLSKLPRLTKLYRLIDYLQQRALHYYAYGSENMYRAISAEYETSLPMPTARERVRPIIEDTRNKATDVSTTFTRPSNQLDDTSTISSGKQENDRSTRKRGKATASTAEHQLDAAKKAQLEMARNLKNMGVDINTISKAAPQLSLDEIAKL